MRLFEVEYMGYSGDYSVLMVGNSEDEIRDRDDIDDQCYSMSIREVTEVDGYKIGLST